MIEYIVRSLGRRIAEGKLAVELLLELSHHETLRNGIGMVQGCILLLVTMSNSDDNQAASHAKELLDCLSFSDQNVIQMAKANYFTHLLQRLSSGSFRKKDTNLLLNFLVMLIRHACLGVVCLCLFRRLISLYNYNKPNQVFG